MAGYLNGLTKWAKKKVKEAQRPPELIKWQKRLETAKSGQNLSLMDKREYLYLGDREVDKNVNATTAPTKAANNIWNIIFEFTESQVSNQIPMPQVKSKREGFGEHATSIQDSISNDLRESDIEQINDQNERITPIQGFSIIEVCWDPDFKHHLYKGEIKLYGRHPKQLVPQPKVYNLQKMDFFFVLSDVTKDYVKRRYGKDLEGENEQYPENTRLFASPEDQQSSSGSVTMRSGGDEEEEPLTEIVCWYKDEDDDICKYVWINDTVLEDLPKFFYRRFGEKIREMEKLENDVLNDKGELIAQAGEEVPYFVPNRYPVSIRINVPRNFMFGGQSDLDIIRDQQDSIKRVVHKMEEKLVKGGTIITALDDHTTFKIDDTIYQIIRGTQSQLAAINTKDLTADIQKDIQFVQEQYRMAQSMLGITNSWQGKEDATAQSGKAKQIQVQQASGRMQSKQFNKFIHYKELFEIIFQFKLAFYDELRPYLAQDANGNEVFGEFDKYKFLQRDKAGKLYYNTDFIFGTDGALGLPKDPMFMYQQTLALFQAQAIDQMQLWTILESLQFPQAAKIKKQWEVKMNQQAQMEQVGQQMQDMQGQMQQMDAAHQQTAQERDALVQHLQQLMGELQGVHQQNAQGEADTIRAANEADKQAYDQHVSEQDRAHKQNVDVSKLQLEAEKVAAMREKVGAGG